MKVASIEPLLASQVLCFEASKGLVAYQLALTISEELTNHHHQAAERKLRTVGYSGHSSDCMISSIIPMGLLNLGN